MKMVTVSQAKTRLSAYIKFAEEGQQVVIMRGSKPAVLLRPVSENDLNFFPELSPSAVPGFEKEIQLDRAEGQLKKLGDKPAKAAKALRRSPKSQ
jgi:antitoxin (DNA-binding transcriptional repressor) of toxin-antitoxin stability system